MEQAHRAVRRQIDFCLLRSAVAKVQTERSDSPLVVSTRHGGPGGIYVLTSDQANWTSL